MGSQPRKLISGSINETSKYVNCNDCYPSCLLECSVMCSNICPLPDSPYMYPPPPPFHNISPDPNVKVIFSIILLVVACIGCFMKSLSNRRRRSSLPVIAGPIIGHPIEHINMGGLQPSTIDLVVVRKYKSGEGIGEGTVCSVCLNEFKENETLRLLPNCSHVFHVPCIDTWIKSHTTCPMCRAPIVMNEWNNGPSKS